jgi:2',3'-cyclic-nucleotide 2'-phosphodiesterase (5'-nucleotidase family)
MLTVIGTNDVHGVFLPGNSRGGLATISGYVDAVRAAREEDGGAVLLVDAGDMWQGTLESNLAEGATVVEAYNAMGYTAAAIGNHEFDFGPVGDAAIPEEDGQDGRGALRQRATEMNFPLLAANLIDESTGKAVDWENVSPSTMIEVQGVKIGIIGAITEETPYRTMPANIVGLRVETLITAITREAQALRDNGASIVIVTVHAGSRCEEFSDPYDLSSCFMDGEIFRVANALAPGLVNHIVAGHTHERIAHFVNGISITSSIARTVTFARADFVVDRSTGKILETRILQPQPACPYVNNADGECARMPQTPCPYVNNADGECARVNSDLVSPAVYEGRPVVPDPAIIDIGANAMAYAEDKKNEALGPYLETPFLLEGNPESPLGNLFTDAMLDLVEGDIAIHNVTGGIRATLPAGQLTFGAVYEVFPFDNRIVVLTLTGREIRRILANQAQNHRRRAGISGVRVFVECESDTMKVRILRPDGSEVLDHDDVNIIANDFLVLGGDGIFEPVIPEGGFEFGTDKPLARDVLLDWFRAQDARMNAASFMSDSNPRWNLPENLPESCTLPTLEQS